MQLWTFLGFSPSFPRPSDDYLYYQIIPNGAFCSLSGVDLRKDYEPDETLLTSFKWEFLCLHCQSKFFSLSLSIITHLSSLKVCIRLHPTCPIEGWSLSRYAASIFFYGNIPDKKSQSPQLTIFPAIIAICSAKGDLLAILHSSSNLGHPFLRASVKH